MLTATSPDTDTVDVTGDEFEATVNVQRHAPKFWRRVRHLTRAGNARYDLPADFAAQVSSRVHAIGARIDVEVDTRRHFRAEVTGTSAQLNQVTSAVIDYMDSLAPEAESSFFTV